MIQEQTCVEIIDNFMILVYQEGKDQIVILSCSS